MKYILTLMVVFGITSVCYSQKQDCNKFKTGKFYYSEILDYGYTIRDKKIQKSFIKEKNMWVTWDIKWTSDCDFELKFKSSENGDGVFKAGDRITVSIVAVSGDCYTFTSTFYNSANPTGKKIPSTEMCIKKD